MESNKITIANIARLLVLAPLNGLVILIIPIGAYMVLFSSGVNFPNDDVMFKDTSLMETIRKYMSNLLFISLIVTSIFSLVTFARIFRGKNNAMRLNIISLVVGLVFAVALFFLEICLPSLTACKDSMGLSF